MDDILLVTDRSAGWDSSAFIGDFQASTCYLPPLKLEEATQDTYLETFIELENNRFNHRLKNTFEKRADLAWKYKDYYSYNQRSQKRGLIAGILMKLDLIASASGRLVNAKR